ncbi:MAG: sigma 54-interacting transcriptional regulator [Candidatus Marinimicrobia bacterium]|nr:sigma 54-interacting transcriptional regulator [Candidatus Neomarinimicrobiota bacterium]
MEDYNLTTINEHFKALARVNQVINSIKESEPLLSKIMDIAIEAVGAERGFLVLTDNGGFEIKAARNISQETISDITQVSTSIIRNAISENQPILTHDAQEDPRFSGSESVIFQQINSAACVPLTLNDKPLGAIYLDSRVDREKFNQETLVFLMAFANYAAMAIENVIEFEKLKEENILLQKEVRRLYAFEEIIGKSPKMQDIFNIMSRIMNSDISVLLEGESGTGKELVARALHYNSHRREKPFVAQFCGNLAESLLESELFGHKKGSFTGAINDKKGLFEYADGGTFFLDEISEISPQIQAKLLRVLQNGEIRRVGETESIRVNVRIISATNRDLHEEVKKGNFREDLYYRLNVIQINMPALRERHGDISLLTKHFLKKFAKKSGDTQKRLCREALKVLEIYHWPGNVRELENCLERAIVLSSGMEITVEDLFIPKTKDEEKGRRTLKEIEKDIVLKTLEEETGNKTRTAEVLGVSLRWLHYKLNEWDISGKKSSYNSDID